MDDEKTLQLLEKLDEQIELQREGNQLLGELLSGLDRVLASLANEETHVLTDVKTPPRAVASQAKGPVPPADGDELKRAYGKAGGAIENDKLFWPSCPAPPGWVRKKISFQDGASLQARIDEGCLCGGRIVVKQIRDEAFHTCEKVTAGGCSYRPAAHPDKLTFLTNLPPSKG